MTVKRRPYKTYPKAFKQEALRLMEETEQSASQIAVQRGVIRDGPRIRDQVASYEARMVLSAFLKQCR